MHNSALACGGEGIRLSSRLTTLPTLDFLPPALLGIFIVVAAIAGRDIASVLLLLPVLGFYFLLRSAVSDLADEVIDCGDSLLVRKGTVEDRIPLRDIGSVRASLFWNPDQDHARPSLTAVIRP